MTHDLTMFIPSKEPNVQLEVIVAQPRSAGPYPTIIFNHGSTGQGNKPSLFSRSMSPSIVKEYFNARGWLVLFPQRRGRGKSTGRYAEGLAADGTGYSCEPEVALRGFERAVEDLDAVMAYVQTRPDVDLRRVAIGGVSRGGILSIAYAGMSSTKFCGAINFNGGWLGRACPTHETVNPLIFKKGAVSGSQSLWLHGSYDQYYRINHCRRNFESFISAGGKGNFVAAPAGHGLLFKPRLWKNILDTYMLKIEEAVSAPPPKSPYPISTKPAQSRIVEHLCMSPNCNQWGSFGFDTRNGMKWYCGEHKSEGV